MHRKFVITTVVLVIIVGLALAAHQFNLAGLLLSLNPHATP
jgi:hypothetical protein